MSLAAPRARSRHTSASHLRRPPPHLSRRRRAARPGQSRFRRKSRRAAGRQEPGVQPTRTTWPRAAREEALHGGTIDTQLTCVSAFSDLNIFPKFNFSRHRNSDHSPRRRRKWSRISSMLPNETEDTVLSFGLAFGRWSLSSKESRDRNQIHRDHDNLTTNE